MELCYDNEIIMQKYNPQKIEKKWQKKWYGSDIFKAKKKGKNKLYLLVEFPYPSGNGLHVGHCRPYIAFDVIARKRRMQGQNVLFPMGWDAFGLPTENYAIKTGIHPTVATKKNTEKFKNQMKTLGLSFDWSREINTTDPKYYKWTQWIFIKLFEKGLAYKAKMAINWCPSCKIGLANEEVVDGKCERCGTAVEKREKEQWLIKITKYADRLIKDLDLVSYPERVKDQQKNWIGRSEGININYKIKSYDNIKRVIILHAKNSSSKTDFYPWLKKQLESGGYIVEVPNMPNTSEPNDDEQTEYVLKNYTLDEKTAVVGHSFGGIVALRLLEKGVKFGRLVLVATPYSGKFLDGKERPSVFRAIKKGFNFEKIKKNCEKFTTLYDIKDKVIPLSDGQSFSEKLDCILIKEEAMETHFGAKEEPDVLSAVMPIIRAFTTRPDTNFGATFLVAAPDSKFVKENLEIFPEKEKVRKYIKETLVKSDIERTATDKKKTGVFTGWYAINSLNNKEMPIYAGDFVLGHFGTGCVVGVPGHDKRDFEFAKAMGLEVIRVVVGKDGDTSEIKEISQVQEESGTMINSGFLNGKEIHEAAKIIMDYIVEKGWGKKLVNYKLRDWVFSRQHYWGEPIPMIFCQKCGWQAVPEKDLPVELPKVKKYQPTDTGESPLSAMKSWVNIKCPECKEPAKRETDTMPNWAGSNWYYLAYVMQGISNFQFPISKYQKVFQYWMPVDWYNGGMEHTTLHLLYSRFIYKFLWDIGAVPKQLGPEPYKKRTSHGIILGSGGIKMSKSKGNVINPDDVIKQYGADTLRIYEMFMGPFEQMIPWDSNGIIGARRFLEKVYNLVKYNNLNFKDESLKLKRVLNFTIKVVGEDIEKMKFNTAISRLMTFINAWPQLGDHSEGRLSRKNFQKFLVILSPFAPHLAEELWEVLKFKGQCSKQKWPSYDLRELKRETVMFIIQVNGKVRDKVEIASGLNQRQVENFLPNLPKIKHWVEGKEMKKVIFVPNKLINIVV